MKKIKLIILTIILSVSFSCQEEQPQILAESIPIDKEKIAVLANQFNAILTKNAALDFHKISLREIPGSPAISNFLSVLSKGDLKIAHALLNHNFFNKVFYRDSPSSVRKQEEQILSDQVGHGPTGVVSTPT